MISLASEDADKETLQEDVGSPEPEPSEKSDDNGLPEAVIFDFRPHFCGTFHWFPMILQG